MPDWLVTHNKLDYFLTPSCSWNSICQIPLLSMNWSPGSRAALLQCSAGRRQTCPSWRKTRLSFSSYSPRLHNHAHSPLLSEIPSSSHQIVHATWCHLWPRCVSSAPCITSLRCNAFYPPELHRAHPTVPWRGKHQETRPHTCPVSPELLQQFVIRSTSGSDQQALESPTCLRQDNGSPRQIWIHLTPMFLELHWLPAGPRALLKILVLTCKGIHCMSCFSLFKRLHTSTRPPCTLYALPAKSVSTSSSFEPKLERGHFHTLLCFS